MQNERLVECSLELAVRRKQATRARGTREGPRLPLGASALLVPRRCGRRIADASQAEVDLCELGAGREVDILDSAGLEQPIPLLVMQCRRLRMTEPELEVSERGQR